MACIFKTKCIRFCGTEVLGETHEWILENLDIWDEFDIAEDETEAYSIEIIRIETDYTLVIYLKLYNERYMANTICENTYSITKEQCEKIKKEYDLFEMY